MVTGAPGFLSRAVLNHDSSKVASVLSCLGLGVARSTLSRADSAKVEVLAEQEIKQGKPGQDARRGRCHPLE